MNFQQIHDLKYLSGDDMALEIERLAPLLLDKALELRSLHVFDGSAKVSAYSKDSIVKVVLLALVLNEGLCSPTVPMMKMYMDRVKVAAGRLGVAFSEVQAANTEAKEIQERVFSTSTST